MDATDKNIGEIFDRNLRILAPLFQRPYVWNREENWIPLWEAIKEVTERRLADDVGQPRFLGAIVLDQLSTRTGDVEARQVIDGQQRLITLQIALAAMRDLCMDLGSQSYYQHFDRLTTNLATPEKSAESVFKVWPTNKDRAHYATVLSAGGTKEVLDHYKASPDAKKVGHLIPDAYLFFIEALREWFIESNGDRPEIWLECLLTAMRQDLLMVVIDLGKQDDAQMIFETLNALGTPLLPADLVKNYIFHRAEVERLNIEQLYEKYWNSFDENSSYWRQEVRQGRLNRPRIDLYLQHYLTLKRQNDVGATHLFATFKDYVNNGSGLNVEEHMTALKEYSEVYENFDEFPPDTREGLFFYRLKQIDTNTIFPVLLEVFKNPDSDEDKLRILDDIESYLVRRVICGLTQKNYNRFFVELVKRLSRNGFTSKNVRDYLVAKDADTSRWPTDEEIDEAFTNNPLFKTIKRANLRMILEGIEMAKRDGKSEKIQILEKLTVEHLLPQAWREHWPLPEGSGAEEEMIRDQVLHSIGNLTLLTKKLNPSVSNSAWITKKEAIASHSALAMNREITSFDTWSETEINLRSAELSNITKKTWKHPATT